MTLENSSLSHMFAKQAMSSLGEKIIPFRIVAHDPRKFDKFKQRWMENENDPKWSYSAAEMEEDVFRHRLGKHPLISVILSSLPIVSPDKIPETGSLIRHVSSYDGEVREPQQLSADESDAIIVENRNDVALLRELANFASIGLEYQTVSVSTPLDGDIVATWNTAARSGVRMEGRNYE